MKSKIPKQIIYDKAKVDRRKRYINVIIKLTTRRKIIHKNITGENKMKVTKYNKMNSIQTWKNDSKTIDN